MRSIRLEIELIGLRSKEALCLRRRLALRVANFGLACGSCEEVVLSSGERRLRIVSVALDNAFAFRSWVRRISGRIDRPVSWVVSLFPDRLWFCWLFLGMFCKPKNGGCSFSYRTEDYAMAILQVFELVQDAGYHFPGSGKGLSGLSILKSISERVLRKPTTSGLIFLWIAQSRQSSKSASKSRCTNRLTSAEGIRKTTARSCARLPAAMICHPRGSAYSPILRSRVSW